MFVRCKVWLVCMFILVFFSHSQDPERLVIRHFAVKGSETLERLKLTDWESSLWPTDLFLFFINWLRKIEFTLFKNWACFLKLITVSITLSHIAATRKRHHSVFLATAEVTQICSSCLRALRVLGEWGVCVQINLFNSFFLKNCFYSENKVIHTTY